MKYYSETLKKVFDTVDKLNEAEHEAKIKDDHINSLKHELDELDKKMNNLEKELDKLSEEREEKYQRYLNSVITTISNNKTSHVTVTKNGKVLMDEDVTDFEDDGLFGLSRLLKSLY
jgi:predicted  nucleic acid-binding Zn-ribbon protein